MIFSNFYWVKKKVEKHGAKIAFPSQPVLALCDPQIISPFDCCCIWWFSNGIFVSIFITKMDMSFHPESKLMMGNADFYFLALCCNEKYLSVRIDFTAR